MIEEDEKENLIIINKGDLEELVNIMEKLEEACKNDDYDERDKLIDKAEKELGVLTFEPELIRWEAERLNKKVNIVIDDYDCEPYIVILLDSKQI
ncbi:MAG: hypothetical protein ACP5HH_07325 [Fervidicoccaceae archaeon]